MLELLDQEIHKHGDRYKIIPIECLDKLKTDINELRNAEKKNSVVQMLVRKYYKYEIPKLEFEPRSVIITASASPIGRVVFQYENKRIPVTIPPTYMDMNVRPAEIERYLNDVLNPNGSHVKRNDWLPQKMLAVRSGLCMYGRNNISYTAAFGSFQRISTLYSDIPCKEENWFEFRQMDSCADCKACLNNCPNQAITEDSFRIDARRCLTGVNEHDGQVFPDWIDPSVHHCVVGCMKCQECCPHNKKFLQNVVEPAEFSEEETCYILSGGPLDRASEELKDKISTLEMTIYYKALPRNLKALFNTTCDIHVP